MKYFGIIGAGGFGREVMPLAAAMLKNMEKIGEYELVFVDDHPNMSGTCNGYTVITADEFLKRDADEKYFNVAIGNPVVRKRIAEPMLDHHISPFRINAGNFLELDGNQTDEGAIFCPFSMITSNTKIGRFFHANIYAYVAHDCTIGSYVTFAPAVHCNGNVVIEDNVYVGTGVIIREGTAEKPIIIGAGAVLGMGAVITKSVPPFTTVVGNPAKPLTPAIPDKTGSAQG